MPPWLLKRQKLSSPGLFFQKKATNFKEQNPLSEAINQYRPYAKKIYYPAAIPFFPGPGHLLRLADREGRYPGRLAAHQELARECPSLADRSGTGAAAAEPLPARPSLEDSD